MDRNRMSADYEPIDCGLHDRLESHAVLRTPCRIRYRDELVRPREVEAVIVDVYASDGAEYLDLSDGSTIRLDRLLGVEPV